MMPIIHLKQMRWWWLQVHGAGTGFIDCRLPLVPGRGYSITLENSPYRLNHPAVLMEGRVAITPMDGNKIRFGAQWRLLHRAPPRMNRVEGIIKAVKRYFRLISPYA
jgi:D-amino-acid dehydrogenase